jgi:hypothetical protein
MSSKDSTDDSSTEPLLNEAEVLADAEEEEEQLLKPVQNTLAQKIWDAAQGEIIAYQASLTEADLQRVRQLAPLSEYTVKYFKPTGKKFKDPFGDDEEEVEQEDVTLIRKKISQHQFRKIQDMRTKLRLDAQKPIKKRDPKLNNWGVYEYMAYCFFGIKPEEFEHYDWEEMRPILDACEERTARGLPSTQRPSSGPSTLPAESRGVG